MIKQSFKNYLILTPDYSKSEKLYRIQYVPQWLEDQSKKPKNQLFHQPVKSVLGQLGFLLHTVAEEIMKSTETDQSHDVDYKDKNGLPRHLKLHVVKLQKESLQTVNLPFDTDKTYETLILVNVIETFAESDTDQSYKSADFMGIIGTSKPMKTLFEKIRLYGPTDAPVVITGETGTGKELVALALHKKSLRSKYKFVAMNCTALNEELFESELFGHEKGSFTGAVKTHHGRFERADNGTLFLDEIGDMPPRTQAKMLRVLEEQSFERVGGEREINVDVRIMAATNLSLELAVSRGQFRSDLYHRIAVLRLHVPPLRKRIDDIPLLVGYFLDILNRRYKKDILRLTPDAIRLLQAYHWPGNIRELRNVIERVYVETQSHVIGRNAFKEWEFERDFLAAGEWNLNQSDIERISKSPLVTPYRKTTKASEISNNWNEFYNSPHTPNFHRKALPAKSGFVSDFLEGEYQLHDSQNSSGNLSITQDMLVDAYTRSGGNITQASRLLGIHKATFYRSMKRMGLTRKKLDELSSPN